MNTSLWKWRMKHGLNNARTLYHVPEDEPIPRDDFDQPSKAESPVHAAADAHHASAAPRKTPTHAGLVKDHHRHKTG